MCIKVLTEINDPDCIVMGNFEGMNALNIVQIEQDLGAVSGVNRCSYFAIPVQVQATIQPM